MTKEVQKWPISTAANELCLSRWTPKLWDWVELLVGLALKVIWVEMIYPIDVFGYKIWSLLLRDSLKIKNSYRSGIVFPVKIQRCYGIFLLKYFYYSMTQYIDNHSLILVLFYLCSVWKTWSRLCHIPSTEPFLLKVFHLWKKKTE